jgi:hypothetical protein
LSHSNSPTKSISEVISLRHQGAQWCSDLILPIVYSFLNMKAYFTAFLFSTCSTNHAQLEIKLPLNILMSWYFEKNYWCRRIVSDYVTPLLCPKCTLYTWVYAGV